MPNPWLFAKFVLVGGTGLCIVLALTYILTDILHVWYFISFVLSTWVSWTFVFFGNAIFTFDAEHAIKVQNYFTFIAGYLMLFCVNASIVFILTSVIGVYYEISILVGTAVTTLLTFWFSSSVIFIPVQDSPDSQNSLE
jgi:putative flippase GtrA